MATSAAYGLEWMGYHLRKQYGSDMVVFGFAFNQGSFQAIESPGGSGRLRPFQVKPAPAGSLDSMLASSGLTLAAIDLRALPKDGQVAAWFDQPHVTRSFGAGYTEQSEEPFFLRVEGSSASTMPCSSLRKQPLLPKRTGERPPKSRNWQHQSTWTSRAATWG